MRVQLVTLRYSATFGGFDQRPIEEATLEKELVAFREHFFVVNEVPHLVCVLTWQDAVVHRRPSAAAGAVLTRGASERSDPTANLDQAQCMVFNRLREWRAAKSRREGVPPYVLFTNRELSEIVLSAPENRSALANVRGVGASKIERHGAEVLSILHAGGAPAAAEPTL